MTDEPAPGRHAPGVGHPQPGAAGPRTASGSRRGRVFGSPAFFRLWIAQVVSATGDWLGLVAITALADRVGGAHAGASIGLVLAARIVPGFFLAPLAGVLIDRWDRKKVMVVCDIARAMVMLSLPFVNSIAGLVIASLVLEVFTLLWSPAKEASVPHLVPRASLSNANSLSLVAAYGTFPVGAALFVFFAEAAGWFANFDRLGSLHFDRTGLAFSFNAATFLFTALLVSRLPIPRPTRAPARAGARRFDLGDTFREMREGWEFIFINPVVRAVNVGIATGLVGGGMLIPLGPIFAKEVLGAGDAGYGALVTALGSGVTVGVIALSLLQRVLPKPWVFTIAVLVAGVALVFAASSSTLTPAIIAVALMGICAGTVYVLGFTLLHEHVADEFRGRIFTALYTLVRMCLLVAMMVGPFLTELLDRLSARWLDRSVDIMGFEIALPGVRLTLLLAGCIIVFAGWLAALSLQAGARLAPEDESLELPDGVEAVVE